MDPHSRAAKKIKAMELRCYLKILRISYKDHVAIKEVHAKIQQDLRCYCKILRISYKDHVPSKKSMPRSSRQ